MKTEDLINDYVKTHKKPDITQIEREVKKRAEKIKPVTRTAKIP